MFFSLGGTKNNVWHLLFAENPPLPRGGGYGALGVNPPPSEHGQGLLEQNRSTGHSAHSSGGSEEHGGHLSCGSGQYHIR